MQTVHLSRDVVPIGEFKAHAARWFESVKTSGRPLVITLNGKPAGVLISPVEFDRLQERERFVESVKRGLADADAGRVMSTTEVKKKLAARRKKR